MVAARAAQAKREKAKARHAAKRSEHRRPEVSSQAQLQKAASKRVMFADD